MTRAKAEGRRAGKGGIANGAGIAADPTLTDAWASCLERSTGKPAFHRVQRHTWRPMSHAVRGPASIPRPKARPFGMPEGKFPRLASSPALAPASGLVALHASRLSLAKASNQHSARNYAKPRLHAHSILNLKRSPLVRTARALNRRSSSQSFTLV